MTEPGAGNPAKLERNARMYRPDPQLDRADLFEKDRQAWDRLPARVRDLSLIPKDMRDVHRDAAAAGIPVHNQAVPQTADPDRAADLAQVETDLAASRRG